MTKRDDIVYTFNTVRGGAASIGPGFLFGKQALERSAPAARRRARSAQSDQDTRRADQD
jgi:hypothetical protein